MKHRRSSSCRLLWIKMKRVVRFLSLRHEIISTRKSCKLSNLCVVLSEGWLCVCFAEFLRLLTLTAAARSSEAWTDLSLEKEELLEYWICRLSLVLHGWTSSGGRAAGDLPRLNYFYIAGKLIAASRLLNLELIQGNGSSHPEHLSLNLSPLKVESCETLLLRNTIC